MCRRDYKKDRRRCQQTSRKKHNEENLKPGTYILECTRAFFTRQSDGPYSGVARFEPCSGAACLGPAVSSTAPLRPVASTATSLSAVRSGADPPALAVAGAGPWLSSVTRDT
jgi:hypothetical protein